MKLAAAIIGTAAFALASCGDKSDVAPATNNLEATAVNAATSMEEAAADNPNATQSNVLVNDAVALTNAEQASANATDKHK